MIMWTGGQIYCGYDRESPSAMTVSLSVTYVKHAY